ncbi:cystinosin [Tanacetum coccineum]
MSNRHQELASLEQTASGKDFSNSLIADSLLRTIWFLTHHASHVVGLNFDFVVLNLTKHSSYLIYNAAVYFSSAVQLQYHQKYGFNEMIPVAANDVAFSIHAVVLTAFTLFQIAIYDPYLAIPGSGWSPALVMNFKRKSTIGFSIGNILLDLLGGVANYGQMAIQSIDQHSWVNFYGNIGKTLLSLVCDSLSQYCSQRTLYVNFNLISGKGVTILDIFSAKVLK